MGARRGEVRTREGVGEMPWEEPGLARALADAAAVAGVGAGASGLKRRVYRGHRCGAWQWTLGRP